jgi:uncharacterized protein (TIGR02118 family)
MYQMTVLYAHPADPGAFDDYYATTHAPIAAKLPGLVGYTYGKADNVGGDPAHYLIAMLTFESRDALFGALGSEVGKAANEDMANFASAGATLLFSEITTVAATP